MSVAPKQTAERPAGVAGPAVEDATRSGDEVWQTFASPQNEPAFFQAWLAIQCRQIDGVSAAVLLIADPQTGGFAPMGVWPDPTADVAELREAAEAALRNRAGTVHRPEQAPRGVTHLAYPLMVGEEVAGIVVLAIDDGSEAQLGQARRLLHWGVGWLDAHVWRRRAHADEARIDRAAIALDMLGAAEEHAELEAAAMAVANAIANRLRLTRAAIGLVPPGQGAAGSVKIRGVSSTAWFSKKSPLVGAIANAMEEAIDQHATVAEPVTKGETARITVAHRAVRKLVDDAAVASFVMLEKNAPVGAIYIERAGKSPIDDETRLIAEAVAALLGPVLSLKARQHRLVSGRLVTWCGEAIKAVVGRRRPSLKIAVAAGIAAVAFVTFFHTDFRVSANAALEGRVQRSAVAPFAGYLAEAPKRAGDRVEEGEVLATMDDRDLRLDELKWQSELSQLDRQRRRVLAESDRAEAALLSAQMQQAEAQLRLTAEKLKRTAIRTPISGVVLSGDLSQSLGSPMEQGEVLFVVAPLASFRVVLEVAEGDLRYVEVAQRGTLVLPGIADAGFPIEVTRVTSVAKVVEGKNVFRVEADIEETAPAVRPGMEGVAKITIDRRSLIWIWTRRLIDWVRIFVWTWVP